MRFVLTFVGYIFVINISYSLAIQLKRFFFQAEDSQKDARDKFETLSNIGKQELTEFKGRRVTAFRKNLLETGELELKHAKVKVKIAKLLMTSAVKLRISIKIRKNSDEIKKRIRNNALNC